MKRRSFYASFPGSPSLLSDAEILRFEQHLDSPSAFSLDAVFSQRKEGIYNPRSPSAVGSCAFADVLADPQSPSATVAREEAASSTTDATIGLLQQERDNDSAYIKYRPHVAMKKATCKRASREARPSDPSSEATMQAYNIMYQKFQEIKRAKIERAPREVQALKSFKPMSSSGGKGAAVRTSQKDQSKMNHLASLKAKDVDTNNTEPAFLLGGFTAPVLWDRLAENSLRSNAVNSSVSPSDAHCRTPFQVTTRYTNSPTYLCSLRR